MNNTQKNLKLLSSQLSDLSLTDTNISRYNDPYIFYMACKYGFPKVAQIYYDPKINIHIGDEYLFRKVCKKGYLDIAKWLYSLGGINIHIKNDNPFRKACKYGHLDVAQWVVSLGGVNINSRGYKSDIPNNYAYYWACRNNHKLVATWLISIGVEIYNTPKCAIINEITDSIIKRGICSKEINKIRNKNLRKKLDCWYCSDKN